MILILQKPKRYSLPDAKKNKDVIIERCPWKVFSFILWKVGVNEDGSHFAIGELLDEIFDVDLGSGEEEDDDDQETQKPVNVTWVTLLSYYNTILQCTSNDKS